MDRRATCVLVGSDLSLTLLQLATGILEPDVGSVTGPRRVLYCAQRTDVAPEDLEALLDDVDGRSFVLRDQLGVEDDMVRRWDTSSHGERKRAQIACALWRAPDLLAIDEPTNHLDVEARDRLVDALKSYRGIGLIVSHDRELLDTLCSRCLWLGDADTVLRPGGYTATRALREEREASDHRVREKALRERDAIRRDQRRRREQAQAASRAWSKRGLARKDHSAKAEVDARRVADGGEGKRLRQIEGHVARAEAAVDAARVQKSYRAGIELPGDPCRRDNLFPAFPRVSSNSVHDACDFPSS